MRSNVKLWSESKVSNQGAIKFLIAEHSEVSKTRHLTVKFLSADFAAASKNSGKKSLLPSKNRHYVADGCQRKRTYQQTIIWLFFVIGDEIYDDMPLLN